ncbi:DUF6517 family protein [Haloplanus sp. C73]|uniref:DUF6517 family protein n=1 Tax=Haloplanus sp. C73 TaxID=3421641 RepID=UPI003EB9E3F8
MVAPPSVAADLDDWRRVSDGTETLFSAGGVSVEARVQVYEDDHLRAAVRERTGVDRSWRFFLVARLELSPSPPISGPLRGLVASRASRGFADRLETRGFERVERRERRTLRIGDDEARLFGYDAHCRVADLDLSVDGWLAVWAPDEAFRLAGGAYPTGVDGEGETAAALTDCLDPSAFRSELFELLRATG